MPDAPSLRASSISKSYAGVHALHAVSFDLHPGEVHALVGENSASKSTLIKVTTGATEPDSGALEIHGAAVKKNSPTISRSLGTRTEGDMLQGTLDMLIRQTLLGGAAHGHTIATFVERGSGDIRQVEHGSLYPALYPSGESRMDRFRLAPRRTTARPSTIARHHSDESNWWQRPRDGNAW